MVRTILVYAAGAVVIAAGWLRLEQPAEGAGLALWLALLALLAALPRLRWTKAAALLGAAALAVGSALEVSPLDPGAAGARFWDGFLLFYELELPFPVAEQPDMASVLLLAVFGFCAAFALAVTARRPALAATVLVVAAGWPATLGEGGSWTGALILAGVLVVLAGLGRTAPRLALAMGTVLVVAAVAASTSSAVGREAFLAWQSWDPYDRPTQPVGVDYVWDGNYGGIAFPERKTVVLRIEAGPERTYWRATTLDSFDGERWIEDTKNSLFPSPFGNRAVLTGDPMLPAAARSPANWAKQVVTVDALRDEHLVGGISPVAYGTRLAEIRYGWGGVAQVRGGLTRGTRYSVWSYAPRPAAKTLARLTARYPAAAVRRGRYLNPVSWQSVPAFGTPGREAFIDEQFRSGFLPRPYRALYAKARQVVGDPRTPYGAVAALETWFRTSGGFTYDEQPGPQGAAPLVTFVQEGKRGYCQYFAGAMTLMLRYLGIPARVAVGFTSGRYDERRRTWTVTDHDAHAWVEAWFPRYGWLPFDPTPARGRLGGGYTASSSSFEEPDALAAFGGGVAARLLAKERLERGRDGFNTGLGGGAVATAAEGGRAALPVLVLVLLGLPAAFAIAKAARRRARYLGRDPRSVARACRAELAGFLADQRIEVPPSATLTEIAALLEARLRIDAGVFARAATFARFAPPEQAARAGVRARRELRELERALRRRLSARARFRGLLSLRSLA